MRRMTIRGIMAVAALFLVPHVSNAGLAPVNNTATVLPSGQLSVAGESMMKFDAIKFGGFGVVNYGIGRNLDVSGRFGYSPMSEKGYFGADTEVNLVRRSDGMSASFAGGMHYSRDFGIDVTALMSWKMRTMQPYVGIDADIIFADETNLPIDLIIGTQMPLRKNIAFVAELGVALYETGNKNYVSIGIVIYP
jgi:hypothetical protein